VFVWAHYNISSVNVTLDSLSVPSRLYRRNSCLHELPSEMAEGPTARAVTCFLEVRKSS
jgi:hypothetical protein